MGTIVGALACMSTLADLPTLTAQTRLTRKRGIESVESALDVLRSFGDDLERLRTSLSARGILLSSIDREQGARATEAIGQTLASKIGTAADVSFEQVLYGEEGSLAKSPLVVALSRAQKGAAGADRDWMRAFLFVARLSRMCASEPAGPEVFDRLEEQMRAWRTPDSAVSSGFGTHPALVRVDRLVTERQCLMLARIRASVLAAETNLRANLKRIHAADLPSTQPGNTVSQRTRNGGLDWNIHIRKEVLLHAGSGYLALVLWHEYQHVLFHAEDVDGARFEPEDHLWIYPRQFVLFELMRREGYLMNEGQHSGSRRWPHNLVRAIRGEIDSVRYGRSENESPAHTRKRELLRVAAQMLGTSRPHLWQIGQAVLQRAGFERDFSETEVMTVFEANTLSLPTFGGFGADWCRFGEVDWAVALIVEN